MDPVSRQEPRSGGERIEESSRPALSFVIPAYDEEDHIVSTLEAVHRAVADRFDYEIVVVDHGSTDATAERARSAGAWVVRQDTGTIASARNTGVEHTRGDHLVFLDADVVVTEAWGRRLPEVLEKLRERPETLTGSVCRVPEDAGWLERTWFAPRRSGSFSHIGTGHLVTTRSFFDRLGGFDPSLETGEDYDFSRRARLAGGVIEPDERLRAEHHGFPATLGEFVRREMWHGRSDVSDLRSVLSSRVQLAALSFGLAHLGLLAFLFTGGVVGAAVCAGWVAFLCLASSLKRYAGRSWGLILVNAGLFYVYFGARLLSLFSTSMRRSWRRR